MITRIENILTEEECTNLITYAQEHIQSDRLNSVSDYESFTIDVDIDECAKIKGHLMELGQVEDFELCEQIEVIHYENGHSIPHHDGNDRSHTLVVWLNDDYAGGKLKFPSHHTDDSTTDQVIVGDGVGWSNLIDKNTRDLTKIHQCEKVEGDKWVAVCWLKQA